METTPGASSIRGMKPATSTREVRCLEFYLEATQIALSAAEGETSVARTMLADTNTRVASKVLLNIISSSLTTSMS
jgi:hypothetical protein